MRHIISSGLIGVAAAAFFSSSAFAGNYGGYGGSSYNNYDNDGYYEKKRHYKKKYYKKKTYNKKKAYKKENYTNTASKASAFPALTNNQDKSLPLLTDAKGMALYIFDKDKYGVSNCYKDCATSWPPYLAKDKAVARENFSLIIRKDGAQQWAYKGRPLYYWAGDKKAGEIKGDGVGGVWHILRSKEFANAPESEKETASAEIKEEGEVAQEANESFLTDEKKMTLYIFDKDKRDVSNCYEDCAVSWPPYLVPEKAQSKENFTIVLRKDGSRQWAYKGQPLYYWAGDQNPGDKTGDGVGGVWHIIKI